jgi:hypothetical protein
MNSVRPGDSDRYSATIYGKPPSNTKVAHTEPQWRLDDGRLGEKRPVFYRGSHKTSVDEDPGPHRTSVKLDF